MDKKTRAEISRAKSAMEEKKMELSSELGMDVKAVLREEKLSDDGEKIAKNMSRRAKKTKGKHQKRV